MEYAIGTAVLDGWNVTRLLGEGGYGKVFEIERSEFGQTYRAALKVITVPQSSAEVRSVISEGMSVSQAEAYFHGIVEELMHEFSIMFKLKGTANVVSCEDLRVLEHPDGIGWDILIRMELLHPLLPYVYQHPMARRDIIRLGIDICKALELCQRYNIIHRDIKPENIFISDNGDYKLGDFGIARTIERTSSGLSKKGTYSYMAPEVYAGKEYGFSVDTYSLGLVLYRMLNKNRGPFLPQPPEAITFSSREQALARRVSGEPLPRPFYGEGRLGEIVLKACAFDPKDRYSSPQQLRQELEAILYTQTDAAVIYPDGDELTIDREPYASVRRPAAPGSAEPKPMDATQGVFTDDFRTESEPAEDRTQSTFYEESEPTVEDRTQSAFDAEEPEHTGIERVQKKTSRFIIVICVIWLLIPVVRYVIGILPEPYYGILQYYGERNDAGKMVYYNADGIPYDYDNEVTAQTDGGVASETREDYYDENGELRQYALFQYDAEGNVIEVRRYDKADTLVWSSAYSYNSKGNLSECTVYDRFDNFLLRLTYIYSSGKLIKQMSDTGDGSFLYFQCEYDDAGNMSKEEVGGSDIGVYGRYQCSYDDAGNMIRMEYYNESELTGEKGLAGYVVYSYDAAGNRVRKEHYNNDGKLLGYTVNEFDQQGNTVTSKEYNADGTLSANSLYKYGDHCTVEYQYGQDGGLLAYRIYEYDAVGNVVWEETYNQNDELIEYSLYEFEAVGETRRYVYNLDDGSLNYFTDEDGDEAYLTRRVR